MAPSGSVLTRFDFNNIENLGGRGGEDRGLPLCKSTCGGGN